MTAAGPSRFCSNCGAPLVAGSNFCPGCGHGIDAAAAATSQVPSYGQPPAGAQPPGYGGAGAPPPPGYPAGGPPPPSGPPERRGTPAWVWPALAAALAVVLIVGVVAVIARNSSSDSASGEIFLETAGSIGANSFTNVNLEAPVVTTTAPLPNRLAPTASGAAIQSVAGNSVGLYGGTGSQTRCDREQMIVFLQRNPSQASAFVAALNSDPTLRWSGGTQVTVAQLPQYLRELTPITLTYDTRVTNNGYSNGYPTPRQAVLQAGTAVMVDYYGVPRVRCACGNPLLPPRQVTGTPTYQGVTWPGWNPGGVVVVTEVTTQINTFVLVNINNGQLINRPAGTDGSQDTPYVPPGGAAPTPMPTPTTPNTAPPQGGGATPTVPSNLGQGDVQATLTWTGDLDLDLYVVDPLGAQISYSSKTSPSGGTLDYDKIPSAGDNGPHVENVFWATGTAPRGSYDVWVRALSGSSPSASFTLTVSINGTPYRSVQGTLSTGQDSEHITFTI